MEKFRWIGKSADGNQVVLKKFTGDFAWDPACIAGLPKEQLSQLRRACIVDVETTGLSAKIDAIIEIGIREILFDPSSGKMLRAESAYQSFDDPGMPLSPEIIRLTGITDVDVQGQAIDWQEVDRLLAGAAVIIAHNAAFDRPFVELRSPAARKAQWACSLSQIDWSAKGFSSRKLEILGIYHGFFIDSHRALQDADATAYLLSFADPISGAPYLKELLENARKPMVHLIAANSPFESKDQLKRRGYAWSVEQRFWHKNLPKDSLDLEIRWMEESVYRGAFRGRWEELRPEQNFSANV